MSKKVFIPLVFLLGLFISIDIYATPKGGRVASGDISINSDDPGNIFITQQTSKAIINWDSFNIHSSESVRFLQNNTSAVALNRVLGGRSSFIDGLLSGSGSVFLINSNGVIMGKNSKINVGGFL